MRHTSSNKIIVFLPIYMIVGMCFCVKAQVQEPAKPAKVGGDEYTRVMLFMGNPEKQFNDIKDIEDIFFYIDLREVHSNEPFFEDFLSKHFATINNRRASILVHLLYLKVGGYMGYSLVDRIIVLFKMNPRPFISVLKKREDWVYFADAMKVGDWMEFVNAVRSLSHRSFEGKFKRYVLKED